MREAINKIPSEQVKKSKKLIICFDKSSVLLLTDDVFAKISIIIGTPITRYRIVFMYNLKITKISDKFKTL